MTQKPKPVYNGGGAAGASPSYNTGSVPIGSNNRPNSAGTGSSQGYGTAPVIGSGSGSGPAYGTRPGGGSNPQPTYGTSSGEVPRPQIGFGTSSQSNSASSTPTGSTGSGSGYGNKPNYNSGGTFPAPNYPIEDKDGNHGPGISQSNTSGYGQSVTGNQVPSVGIKPTGSPGIHGHIDHSQSGSISTGHGHSGVSGATNIDFTSSGHQVGASVHQSGTINTDSTGHSASVGFEANVNHGPHSFGVRPASNPESHKIDSNTDGTFPPSNVVASSGASVNLNVNVGVEKTSHGGSGSLHASQSGSITIGHGSGGSSPPNEGSNNLGE